MRAREGELVALAVDEPADPAGRWHAKDHLAHVSWHRKRTAQILDAVRTGGELPPPGAEGDGVQNAIIYAEIRDLPAAEVKADAEESWAALKKAIEDSSDEDLARPHPRQTESRLWESVPSVYGHVGVHVWSWYLDIGETERALEVARWAYGIEQGYLNTPEQLAGSRYNLACAYSRLGRAEDAIPLLREAFEVEPDLKRLAGTDADLDRIRDNSEFMELLAT